jgi:hypothetical protein
LKKELRAEKKKVLLLQSQLCEREKTRSENLVNAILGFSFIEDFNERTYQP